MYHWTTVLQQPFRVVIRNNGSEIFVYEPMKSDPVRARTDQMTLFYKEML